MLRVLKQIPNALLKKYDRRIIHVPEGRISGVDFAHDLGVTIANSRPVCLDIGANEGQTILLLQTVFDDPIIHAFEPSGKVFRALRSKDFGAGVSLHNVALGKEPANREFINYEKSGLSSFLTLDARGEHPFREVEVESREVVEVETVDRFLQLNRVDIVDLLKIDTQGYDLEVLLGAAGSLEGGIIRNVLVELNFVRMYENQGSATDIINLLAKYGFSLVDNYEKVRQNKTLAWCTALFHRRSQEDVLGSFSRSGGWHDR